MLLTLTASCVRSLLSLPGSRPKPGQFDLLDLPSFTQETLGLSGLTLTTDLLAGADRARLEQIRERADKARCACLLLAEPDPLHFGSKDAAPGTAASQRLVRVVEAAHILGCSAAAFKVKAPDDDEALARVAQRLRAAVERAEKLDLNILVSPCDGLTSRPERVTELLKKIGGFRVGTYPDFLAATQTKDPVAYLHRLAPYATVVCGTTIQFEASPETEEPAPEPKAEPAPAAKGKSKAKSVKAAATPPPPAAGKKKPAKAVEPEEPEEDEEFEDDEESPRGGGLSALLDAVLDAGDDEIIAVPPPPKHKTYDLRPLVGALRAVGYDGPLAVDYRGTGDVIEGVLASRDALFAALAAEPADTEE